MTIKDIARMAGVSRATVSKILNNYTDVSEKTRRKVLQIVEETGYQPAFSAQTLSAKRTNLIGVIYAGNINADLTHPFFVEVVNAFKKQIGELGYDLLFFSNEKFRNSQENYLARCQYFRLDGCIIINGMDIETAITELDQSDLPCIGVDIQLTGKKSGFIMTDNRKASAIVVEHFYLAGYRSIAYISGQRDCDIGNARKEGYIQALNQFGISVREEWIQYGDYREQSGYEAMKHLLKQRPYPRAVYTASDLMAFGAIRAIKEAGLSVPDDVAVIGFDDIHACQYSDPTLTTIRQNKEKIGKLAAFMLFDLIKNQVQSSNVMVEPELVIRQSCGGRVE
ncbi:LacI family DNA-binding transcriptional regulator [Laceyella putida]|uniref:LacI family DNA-binding transcriptional regulator n=1 Tax=Laceyella putida TaxID=110101 RepID=A0ABW2RID7_9BACL